MSKILLVLGLVTLLQFGSIIEDITYTATPDRVVGCFTVVWEKSDTTGWSLWRIDGFMEPPHQVTGFVDTRGPLAGYCLVDNNVQAGAGYEYLIGRHTIDSGPYVAYFEPMNDRWVDVPLYKIFMPFAVSATE